MSEKVDITKAFNPIIKSLAKKFSKWRNEETVFLVNQVLEGCWKEDSRPLLIKKIKQENCWQLIFSLPPSMSFSQFKQYESHFADHTGGSVEIEKRGRAVFMTVANQELKSFYKYSWEIDAYNKILLPMMIGYSAKGLQVVSLDEAPHVLLNGPTRKGKSNLMRVMATSLVEARREKVFLTIADPKENEFEDFRDIALVRSSPEEINQVMKAIIQEMNRRKKVFKAAKCVKIQDYLVAGNEMPFIVFLIDELSVLLLLSEKKGLDTEDLLYELLCQGAAYGINIIAAAQRTSHTTGKRIGDLKINFPARICLATDRVNSEMFFDNEKASLLPRIRGRAIMRWDEIETEVQIPFLHPDAVPKILDNSTKGEKLFELPVITEQSQTAYRTKQRNPFRN